MDNILARIWYGTENQLLELKPLEPIAFACATDTNVWYKWNGASWDSLSGTGGGGAPPGSTVVSETGFGQSAAAGTATPYSRTDHTHGTPTDPVPAHVALSDPHTQYTLSTELATHAGLSSSVHGFDTSGNAPAQAHDLGGAKHTADTLANLNAKISDADVVALAGQLGGTAAAPDVRGIRETAGPTLLTLGAITDGEFLKRSGTSIVSSAVSGSGLSHQQVMSRAFINP